MGAQNIKKASWGRSYLLLASPIPQLCGAQGKTEIPASSEHCSCPSDGADRELPSETEASRLPTMGAHEILW